MGRHTNQQEEEAESMKTLIFPCVSLYLCSPAEGGILGKIPLPSGTLSRNALKDAPRVLSLSWFQILFSWQSSDPSSFFLSLSLLVIVKRTRSGLQPRVSYVHGHEFYHWTSSPTHTHFISHHSGRHLTYISEKRAVPGLFLSMSFSHF